VMNTLGQLGCAVGEAAAMCREGGYSPRDLYAKGHVRELQRRLGGDFPGNPDPSRMNWRYIDDESAGVEYRGKWSSRWNHSGGQLGDKTHLGDEAAVAVYPLPVEKAGRYRLLGIVPHLFNQMEMPVAELTVRSGDKVVSLEWNQYPGSGFWQQIATMDLAPGAKLELRRAASSTYHSALADGFAVVPADAK